MHIRGAIAHRLRQQSVDQADDRGVVLGVEEVFDRGQLGHQAVEVDLLADVGHHLRGAAAGAAVGLGEAGVERCARHALQAQRQPEAAPHFCERLWADVVAHQDFGVLGAKGSDQHAVVAREAIRQFEAHQSWTSSAAA